MTLITSNQEKFLKFLGKGSNKIERDRALSIIAEMRDDAGWVNFEDITTRSPQTLTGALDITLEEAAKLIASASAILPPEPAAPSTSVQQTLPPTLTIEMPGTTKCTKCNNALQKGADFCSRCGTPVASKLVCPSCGEAGGVGEAFCRRDGIALVPALDALCIKELMSSQGMSVPEARDALQGMDPVRRSKLQEKAMQRQQGGGSYGSQIFRG